MKSDKWRSNHPYGTTLLAQDTPANQKQWGAEGPFGYVNVAPSICTSDGQCPHYNYQKDATRVGALETPIHLLVASFRDKLCPRTLHNAFMRADNPHRIYIRILEQSVPDSDLIDDASCWDRYCLDYNKGCAEFQSHVHTVWQDAGNSKGPTDARSKLSAMVYWDYVNRDNPSQLDFHRVEAQDFCMETDSHMDFSDHYDTELILMHHRTKNDYAVLSTYVTDISQNNKNPDSVPNLCMVTFTSTIRNWGTKECIGLVTPKLTNAMWGAGLSFHRCHAEINVPVDPYLSGVFDGEEGSRGLRFFTHGYDVYSPDQVLVTHDYHGHQSNPIVHTWGRNNGQKQTDMEVWRRDIERERPKINTVGTKRINLMLGIGSNQYSQEEQQEIANIRASRFGLGTKRTLEQAVEFSGINLRERKMEKNKCGNLIWVPFQDDPDYGLSASLGRGLIDGEPYPTVGATASGLFLRESIRSLSADPLIIGNELMILSGLGFAVLAFSVFVVYGSKLRKKSPRHTI